MYGQIFEYDFTTFKDFNIKLDMKPKSLSFFSLSFWTNFRKDFEVGINRKRFIQQKSENVHLQLHVGSNNTFIDPYITMS